MSFDGVDAVRRESTYRSISEGMSVDPSLSEQNDAVSDFLEKEITLLSDPSKGTILRYVAVRIMFSTFRSFSRFSVDYF